MLTSGHAFNEVGLLENWWTDASLNEFDSRAECFVDQYNEYFTAGGSVSLSVTH